MDLEPREHTIDNTTFRMACIAVPDEKIGYKFRMPRMDEACPYLRDATTPDTFIDMLDQAPCDSRIWIKHNLAEASRMNPYAVTVFHTFAALVSKPQPLVDRVYVELRGRMVNNELSADPTPGLSLKDKLGPYIADSVLSLIANDTGYPAPNGEALGRLLSLFCFAYPDTDPEAIKSNLEQTLPYLVGKGHQVMHGEHSDFVISFFEGFKGGVNKTEVIAGVTDILEQYKTRMER